MTWRKDWALGFSRTLRCTSMWKMARVLGGYLTLGFCLLFWSRVLIKDEAGAGVGQYHAARDLMTRDAVLSWYGLGTGHFGEKVRARTIISGENGISRGLATEWQTRLNVEKRRMGSDCEGCRGRLRGVGPRVWSGSNRVHCISVNL